MIHREIVTFWGNQPTQNILIRPNQSHFSLTAPEPDPQLEEIEYERSWDQNEELGLNDMKTENYETDEKSPKEWFLQFKRLINDFARASIRVSRIRFSVWTP